MNSGEIWRVYLYDTLGQEQSGERPAIVIASLDIVQLAIVVPVTPKLDRQKLPYTHTLQMSANNGLTSNSVAMVFQLRSLAYSRFRERMGILEPEQFERIKTIIKEYLKLEQTTIPS